MRFFSSKLFRGLMLCALPALSGCEFISGDGSAPPVYSIRGTVTGLVGAGLVLQNNGGDDLAITENGLFIFSTELDDGDSYEVTILTQPGSPNQGCVVTNASGVIDMSSVVNVLVTCLGWTAAVKIETDDTDHARTAKLISDSAGSVTAVWTQSDGVRYNLWANRYTLSGGWGTAVKIETEDLGDAGEPVLVVDSGGNVTVVWNQHDGVRLNQWANRYTGSGWGTAVKIETEDLGHAFEAKLVVDAGGNVTAVWPQADGSYNNLWSNRYTFGSGWGTAQKIDSEDLGNVGIPSLVVDGSGNVTAVWTQRDGVRTNQWANRYTGGSWGTAQKIETDDSGGWGAFDSKLVVDGSGNVAAIWRQSSASSADLWSNYYTAGSGWGTAQKIDSEDLGVVEEGESLVVDGSGNVTASWRQHDGANYNLWANRFTAGSGWGTAEKIESIDTGDVDAAVMAVDAAGNVMAAWRQNDGAIYNQWANRYTVGSGWGTAEKIEAEDFGDVQASARLLADDDGNVTAVWVQWDAANFNLWANRYTAGSGWGAAEKIETDDTGNVSTADPELRQDSNGNVTAVWRQFGASYWDLWGNRFVPATGWGIALKIDSEELGDVGPVLSVLMDSAGRVALAWQQDDGTRYNGWAARLQ